MSNQIKQTRNYWVLTPLYGSALFIILYVIAACLYPGGSQINKYSHGFSWAHNYWCTLLHDTAINGEPNPAKPVALTAMFLLGITLSVFWYLFPKYADLNRNIKRTIQVSGIIAMAISMLLFTCLHDIAINVGGFFGLITIFGTLLGLYKNKWNILLRFGILNLLFFALNNYIYWSGCYMICLPIVQKISFLSFLIWISCITVRVYRLRI
jgi:hypothetical protein